MLLPNRSHVSPAEPPCVPSQACPPLPPNPPAPAQLCISDLAQHLHARDGARLSEREAAHITRQLLTALDACARLGVAYRDVKPANLLIRSITADGLPEVVLADFGQARLTTGPQPSNRCSAGTPLYSAPECVYGVGGQESDVWSAGILLYHLLSGAFPFCDPRHQITQVRAGAGMVGWHEKQRSPGRGGGAGCRPQRCQVHSPPGPASSRRNLLPPDPARRASTGSAWRRSPSTTPAPTFTE